MDRRLSRRYPRLRLALSSGRSSSPSPASPRAASTTPPTARTRSPTAPATRTAWSTSSTRVIVSSEDGSGTFIATLSNNSPDEAISLDVAELRVQRDGAGRVVRPRSRSAPTASSTSPTRSRASRSPASSRPATSSSSPSASTTARRPTWTCPSWRPTTSTPASTTAPGVPSPAAEPSAERVGVDDLRAGPAPPRRERLERQEPLHRLGRRRPVRQGPRRRPCAAAS